jgi:hypothetical protein
MADLTVKQYDTWPPLVATLTKGDGTPIDLTTAGTVHIYMKAPAGTIRSGTCSITDAGNGVVSYTFGTADTAVPGTFKVEWDIDFGAGKRQTAPNDTWREILVVESLDP